jgi:hypothetical protein
MASGPDHEQFDLEIGRKHDNAAHRMSSNDMGIQFHLAFFRHRAGWRTV